MATADSYHGKECTIVIKDDAEGTTYYDNTSTPINAKGLEITADFDVDELFSQDSITRRDVVRTAVHCTVRVSYIKQDGVLIKDILGTGTADKDIDGGADAGRTRGSINDTPTANLFNVWGTLTSGSNTIHAKITNVLFTSVPIMVAPEDGWVQVDLEGSGDVVFTEYDT